MDSQLYAECLIATTGVLPDEVTDADKMAAETLPARFERRLRAWLGAPQGSFVYVAPPKDLGKLFDKIAAEPMDAELAAWRAGIGQDVPELAALFEAGIRRARDVLTDAWPRVVLTGPEGVRVLELENDDAEEAHSVWLVVNDPERVVQELEGYSLTDSQARAFREAFPALATFVREALEAGIASRRARSKAWELGEDREGVLRILFGLPPEAPLIAPPTPAPPAAAKVNVDPERIRTQGQASEATDRR